MHHTVKKVGNFLLLHLLLSALLFSGAFYTALVKKGFRIISINTNYCDHMNWWLIMNVTDPAQELQWLIDTLQLAENNHEKVCH